MVSQAARDEEWNCARFDKPLKERVYIRFDQTHQGFQGIEGSLRNRQCVLVLWTDKSYKTAAKRLLHHERHHQDELLLKEDQEDDGDEEYGSHNVRRY